MSHEFDNRYHCDAIIGRKPGRYGEEFVFCSQTVGVRQFWAVTAAWENTGHSVHYCSLPGHQANVRRRFEEKDPPEPTWLHEEPEYADPMTMAKAERDRVESWTLADDMTVTVALDYTEDEPFENREGQPEFNGAFDRW